MLCSKFAGLNVGEIIPPDLLNLVDFVTSNPMPSVKQESGFINRVFE